MKADMPTTDQKDQHPTGGKAPALFEEEDILSCGDTAASLQTRVIFDEHTDTLGVVETLDHIQAALGSKFPFNKMLGGRVQITETFGFDRVVYTMTVCDVRMKV